MRGLLAGAARFEGDLEEIKALENAALLRVWSFFVPRRGPLCSAKPSHPALILHPIAPLPRAQFKLHTAPGANGHARAPRRGACAKCPIASVISRSRTTMAVVTSAWHHHREMLPAPLAIVCATQTLSTTSLLHHLQASSHEQA
jgi:hypothetical protein